MAKSHRRDSLHPPPRGFYERLDSNDDRGAAILGVAYLDAVLEDAFRSRLRPDTPESVFDYRGPVGDLSSRIEMAFALGWIAVDTRLDLTLLRRIRNDFAHDYDHRLSFSEPPTCTRLAQMHVSRLVREGIDECLARARVDQLDANAQAEVSRLTSPRARFTMGIWLIADTIGHAGLYASPAYTNEEGSVEWLASRIMKGILTPLELALGLVRPAPGAA